jgi:uncharacterized glyoxalase superfamily protein PhnB
VYVPDCDATYQRALDAGADVIAAGEPADRPYGERAAFVTDALGNYWFIATRHGEHYMSAGMKHLTPYVLPKPARPLIDFLQRAFGASIEGLHEHAGRIVHGFIQIGGATIEIGEPEKEVRPYAFYIHTNQVDTLYDRAVAAGGRSILKPADQAFGDRLAIIHDPAGNQWCIATRIERQPTI